MSENLHGESNTHSLGSPLVVEVSMMWVDDFSVLGSLLWILFSALILLVGWQEEHSFAIVSGGSLLQQVEGKAKGNWLVEVFLEDGHWKFETEMVGFSDGSDISQSLCKQCATCSRPTTMPTPYHSIFTGQVLWPTSNQQSQSTRDNSVLICLFSNASFKPPQGCEYGRHFRGR